LRFLRTSERKTLRDETLKVLEEYGIEPRRIHVFVANKEEAEAYKKEHLKKEPMEKSSWVFQRFGPQRNFISDYYPVGKPVIHMDDDIQGFIEYDYFCQTS
jgi:hypothetical protein